MDAAGEVVSEAGAGDDDAHRREADERKARAANRADLWDQIWKNEGAESWRKQALGRVYSRIVRSMPREARVLDIGGGVGQLAIRLRDEGHCRVAVLDASAEACRQAQEAGVAHVTQCEVGDDAYRARVDKLVNEPVSAPIAIVATEVYEHLPRLLRTQLLTDAIRVASARTGEGVGRGHVFISVPNNRLGPDEEPQHTCKYTALELLTEAREAFAAACRECGSGPIEAAKFARARVRVEALGPYLLLVMSAEPKAFSLSVCTPARDEAEDLEATLASFRGVADEIVVGVDPRTTDATREVARRYAEVVFDLEQPQGPPGEQVPEGGVHFAHIRNECIARCTSEWVFMTEAHERIVCGEEVLLALDRVMPKSARVGFVLRQGYPHQAAGAAPEGYLPPLQQWAFPWLFKRSPDIRFIRHTHNALDYPEGTHAVSLPQVRTMHERTIERTIARAVQRKSQNRRTLFDDWMTRGNQQSLFYFASELREYDSAKAVDFLELFLATSHNGVQRYQARLIVAKEYMREAMEAKGAQREAALRKAKEQLHSATADDWTRIEHFVWLGDLAMVEEQYEKAYAFYRYASTRLNEPPFTVWWIDLPFYGWITAQRMAMVCGELGLLTEALKWAETVVQLLPDNAPDAIEEAQRNVAVIKEALDGSS